MERPARLAQQNGGGVWDGALEEIEPSKYSDGLRSIPSYILEREM